MAETPPKIIDSEYNCFLCDGFTHSSRVKIFGKPGTRSTKSSIKITRLRHIVLSVLRPFA